MGREMVLCLIFIMALVSVSADKGISYSITVSEMGNWEGKAMEEEEKSVEQNEYIGGE